MTREEAFARIDELAAESAGRVDPGCVADAKRLLELLPPPALAALQRGWVRTEANHPGRVDLLWSKSTSFMDPGNRILSIQTLGEGEFRVDMGNPFEVEWQRSTEGRPLMDRLSFNLPGAEALLAGLTGWQSS